MNISTDINVYIILFIDIKRRCLLKSVSKQMTYCVEKSGKNDYNRLSLYYISNNVVEKSLCMLGKKANYEFKYTEFNVVCGLSLCKSCLSYNPTTLFDNTRFCEPQDIESAACDVCSTLCDNCCIENKHLVKTFACAAIDGRYNGEYCCWKMVCREGCQYRCFVCNATKKLIAYRYITTHRDFKRIVCHDCGDKIQPHGDCFVREIPLIHWNGMSIEKYDDEYGY